MADYKKTRSLDDFQEQTQDDYEDTWTTEDKIAAAHRIMRRLGIEGDLCDPFEGAKTGDSGYTPN